MAKEEKPNKEQSAEEEEFDDSNEDIEPTFQPEESGYIHLIKAVVDPKDSVQRVEMADVPKGRTQLKWANFLAQTLILNEMRDRRDPKHKKIGYGNLAITALTAASRGSNRQFIREMIEFKEIETKEESQPVKMMSGR